MASSLPSISPYLFLNTPPPSQRRFPAAAWGGGRRKAKAVVARMYKGTQMREQRLTEMIEEKVKEAEQVCGEDETSDECKVAWDEVEEVSQAKADLRRRIHLLQQDPLEYFCQDNPETDECRIYED
ncbi:calvin cycle protein CP12-3, chloroplastic [Andrographis paniculata]|uniref:calvin cycle protein CP12-3, chloroplastic n=1 Tax=Andrographis paniculata TaxID=175694 RepID=UPI0021E8CB2E|nr:calvin cycle protein CP12-3, chloroplastic [Andrographis paniculata]